METILRIDKSAAMEEVSRLTAYVGAKNIADPTAYDRMATTDVDDELLETFWAEAASLLVGELKQYGARQTADGQCCELRLELSAAFDRRLEQSMEESAKGYFVQKLAAKWFALTNKEEAQAYELAAAAMIEDIRRKAAHKRAPTRPRYNE